MIILQVSVAMESLLQLLSSAIVAQKKPWITCKQIVMAVFSYEFVYKNRQLTSMMSCHANN